LGGGGGHYKGTIEGKRLGAWVGVTGKTASGSKHPALSFQLSASVVGVRGQNGFKGL
jgi:hypothetical protein